MLVDSYDLDATERALRAALDTSCRTIVDFESGDRERLCALLALASDPILPLACARSLTRQEGVTEVLRALAELTPGQALVTDGLNGSWAWNRETQTVEHQAAFRVDSLDSTGCGDAFHAGYIVGVLEGWDLRLRMEFGALLASRVATRVGGRTALPRQREIVGLIRSDVSAELRSLIHNLHERTLISS